MIYGRRLHIAVLGNLIGMPICIAGMHRSGTSMVTRLLNLCGVSLGDKNDLLAPSTDNPEGFWEKHSLVLLNDYVLDLLEAGWDHAPPFPDGWNHRPTMIVAQQRARAALATFPDDMPWGWKDPRNSLLLPFWKDIVGPDLRVVCCLRNPLEVAVSLARRNGFSQQHSLFLWWRYNQSIIDATTPEQRIVTHYDAYAHDAKGELARVCEALALQPDDATLAAAVSHHKPGLHHHHVTAADAIDAGIPERIMGTYLQLCTEAGSATSERVGDELSVSGSLPRLDDAQSATTLARDLYEVRLEAYVRGLEGAVNTMNQQQRDMTARTLRLEQELAAVRQK